MDYKVILFDMDGVLVMSEPLHYKAWLLVLYEINAPFTLSEDEIIGFTDLTIAKEIIDKTNIGFSPNELFQMKKTHFLSILKSGIPSINGRDEFLLANRKALMGVVSSSSREEIHSILEASNITGHFKFYLGFEDSNLHKPYPDPYLQAMKKFECQPNETLIIEDSPTGVKAGLEAGANVVGLNSSNLLSPDLGIPIFEDYFDIMKWMNENT